MFVPLTLHPIQVPSSLSRTHNELLANRSNGNVGRAALRTIPPLQGGISFIEMTNREVCMRYKKFVSGNYRADWKPASGRAPEEI